MSSTINKPEDQFQRANLEYSEELYELFLEDPSQVPESWKWFFKGMQAAQPNTSASASDLKKEIQIFRLFRAYRDHGNLKSQLDPLGLQQDKGFPTLESFGITKEDLNKKFAISKEILGIDKPLKEVIDFLEKTYCSTLSLGIGNCHPTVRQWFFKEFEKPSFELSADEKIQAFSHLIEGENLEKFLHFRFMGKKRFSLEGLESFIPMLQYLLEKGVSLGMKTLTIGMAHRGRINVLVNLMKKNPEVIFSEFEQGLGGNLSSDQTFTGDVKYHLGFRSKQKTKNGECSIYLGYNPSHLEAVSPVVCGMTRALQRKNKDTKERKTVIPVLIHGDAAFCGQGVTSETLQMSQLKGYKVGGSIHIILNNQVGFTTDPKDARSTLFASDLAKSIKAPVLLVNANDVSACLRAMDLAVRFRQEFKMDIVIDLIGYRKYGHNEGDEPSFTQPIMYKKIKSMPTITKIYEDELLREGIITKEQVNKISEDFNNYLEMALKNFKSSKKQITADDIIGIKESIKQKPLAKTQTTHATLSEVFEVLTTIPDHINLHPKIRKLIEKRREQISNDELDWALCELAACGTLIKDGFSVRLSGQDSKRGTFSHRQATYYDTETGEEFSPLKEWIAKQEGRECCLYNSPLSEMAVLAFEYGNSCMAPDFLTLWEAQFGDFVNGAQIIIDQFISSGEIKWLQKTDITMLLPHAYEGQGPEHSSAYLERFLQLCAEDNMRVCNLTTASNLFHVLRRQKVLLENKKPLIIMTPKSLLRSPKMNVSAKDLIEGQFEEVLWDPNIKDPIDVKTLVLCSGKVYYDWIEHVENNKSMKEERKNTFATFRMEQLYPLPVHKLNPILNGFPNLTKVIWLQEEPKNRGAWAYIESQINGLLKSVGQNIQIQYIGRPRRAASAEGAEIFHKKEQEKIMTNCLAEI